MTTYPEMTQALREKLRTLFWAEFLGFAQDVLRERPNTNTLIKMCEKSARDCVERIGELEV